MQFHLSFPIKPSETKLDYTHKLFFIGSCFAENIGERMAAYKFQTLTNPHGILYNPHSIAKALHRYIENSPLHENELFYANDCWNSWEHHSCFSRIDKNDCLSTINESIALAHQYLKNAKWLFITLGSAHVYCLKSSNKMVGNCHKVPNSFFIKELLSIDSIVTDYVELLEKLRALNPSINIVFTVSPVRYIRDGIIENNRSKARLLEAVHQLNEINSSIQYFPAYELIVDDLRDYRFFKEDFVHPTTQAIDYVFEKLAEILFSEESKSLQEKIKNIINAVRHKPFNEKSDGHIKFKQTFLEKSKQLQHSFSFIDLQKEIEYFSK